MSRSRTRPEADALDVTLPTRVTTRSGASFDPREPTWAYRDTVFNVHLDFSRVPGLLSPLLPSLKIALLRFARDSSPGHLMNLFETFRVFGLAVAKSSEQEVREISELHARQFWVSLRAPEKWRFGVLNGLIQQWHRVRAPGISEACVKYMRSIRKPGNAKGSLVRMHDPEAGPFTDREFQDLFVAMAAAREDDEVPLWVTALFRLLCATGQRPSQYASMKVCDVRPLEADGYVVVIPKGKQRSEHSRDEFEEYSLSPQAGELLHGYVDQLWERGATGESALFPPHNYDVGQGLFRGHQTAKALAARFVDYVQPVAPPTERLDFAPMPIGFRRFRYTYGTRLAEERASLLVIANRLGHSDLQNAGVYIEATSTIAQNISDAMDEYLRPLAMAFKGTLIEDESHATLSDRDKARIWDFRAARAPIGSCTKGGCSLFRPVACYTCVRFEPWLDAPHEELLKQLVAERERIAATGDHRLAAVNDPAIAAIREVIALCAKARLEGAAGSVA